MSGIDWTIVSLTMIILTIMNQIIGHDFVIILLLIFILWVLTWGKK